MPTKKPHTCLWPFPVTHCNLCHTWLPDLGTFIDGLTTYGYWAIMCPKCHKLHGRGLGELYGHRYHLHIRDQQWRKTTQEWRKITS